MIQVASDHESAATMAVWLTVPPFTSALRAKAEFAALLKVDDFALFEKVLVWFQAQHTIPSPYMLCNIKKQSRA
jgi:hypothetical protein